MTHDDLTNPKGVFPNEEIRAYYKTNLTADELLAIAQEHAPKDTPCTVTFTYHNERISDVVVLDKTLSEIGDDIRKQTIEEIEDTIKQLKMIHTMELDAVSCKSLEDFIVWSEHRKDLSKH